MSFETISWLRWPPHPRVPEGGEPYGGRWLALFMVSMGIFLVALDVTIVGVAAPSLSRALNASATQIQWTFDAYTVIVAGFVVLGGGLAERFGRKGWVQLGMLVFAVGSAVSAFAPNFGVLIAGRVVSGLGAAVVFPASLSITSSLFELGERQRAIGIFASISAAGMVAGPLIGGLLIEMFWWGAAFLVVVPVALLAIVGIAFTVPPSRGTGGLALDEFGALLSVLGLSGIVFAVIEGPTRGWGEALVLGPLAVGVVCAVAFVVWELRSGAPLFDLRVFLDPRVVGGALAMATVYFTLNGSQLLLPQYLVEVLGFSSLQVGLTMSPFGIALALLSPRSNELIEKYGQRAMLVFSLVFMAAGLAVFTLLPVWGGLANVLSGMVVFGVGFGLIVAPATAAIMVAVPSEKAGDGSAVNMVSRQIGGAIGVAVTGSVAAVMYRARLDFADLPLSATDVARVKGSLGGVVAVRESIGAATASKLDAMADTAMVEGVAVGMGLCAATAAAVAVIAFLALRQRAEVK